MSMLIEENMTRTMEEPTEIVEEQKMPTEIVEEQTMPTMMEYITPTTMEQLIAALEKLRITMENQVPKFTPTGSFSPSQSSPTYEDGPNDKIRKGRKVWQKYIQMCHSKNNPKLWNSECLIYGLHKLADDATKSGEEARTYGEFFPEGIHIDDQGISGESILEKAAEGNFDQVMKLRELHHNTPADEFPIERIMATLWYSTCEPLARKLIHWVAYYNQLEILEWMLHFSVILSAFDEEDDQQVEKYERQVEDDDRKFDDKYKPGVSVAYGFLRIKAEDSLNAKDLCGFTPMHLATMENHEGIVKRLFAFEYNELLDIYIVAENMTPTPGEKLYLNKLTILHCAARNKSSLPIVKLLLERHKDSSLGNSKPIMIEAKSSSGKTALHYAAEFGNWEVVKVLLEFINMSGNSEYVNIRDVYRFTPLHLAALNSHVEVVEIILRDANGLNVSIVTWEGITALDIAKRNENKHDRKEKVNQRIVDMLESYDVNWLLSERQKYSAAASFLLVGAALIAGITYAGWLQPPLGLTENYDFPSSGPPGTYDSYVGIEEHREIQIFWVFNAIAFFCSIVTFIMGADAGIPKKCTSLREEVVHLRKSVVKASFILAVAILFAIGAFSSAGIIVLPPIARQRAPTYVIVAIGVIICLKILTRFIMKLWNWFHSPSLQFTMEKNPNSKEFEYDGGWILKSHFEMPIGDAKRYFTSYY